MAELVGPACEVVSCLWPSLARRINYVKNLKRNFKKLERNVEALCNRREDIYREIESDTSKILSRECQGWTKEVEKIETEVKKIKEEVDENRRCLNGCCFPDICARKRLGKRIVTMLNDVHEHNKRRPENVIVDAPPAVVEVIPLPGIEGGETAIERTVKCIMEKITDADNKIIGLWGMGGVGKTTALTRFNNLLENDQKFQVVILVTVSKEGSVRMVQNEIAKRLQMDKWNNESEESGAKKLHEKLKTMKYLLLLDDLWSPMKLEDVGIPLQEGSKVVLTTRNREVCRFMETNDNIKVECLSEEEAWNLFRAKAGDVVDSPSIEPIARDVLEECDGLPLAIVVIGKSLRMVKNVYVWQNALNHLKSARPLSDATEAGLFERLKLSYDRLKDVERECFLYCALYPEDYEIPVDELVKLWGAEGFTLGGGMDSLDDADASRHTIVSNLVDAFLLQKSKNDDDDDEDCVKMHDVLRDLALWIASSKFLVRAGLGIDDEKKWEEVGRISLMENELSGGLPTNPRCNALATLLLQGNEYLKYIPDMFFQHMPSLRVLDLCETNIKVLPASVSNLVNLRGLYVVSGWGYNPVDLPREIGALEKLEVLHVSVGSLPLEVRQLTSLRRLWVEFRGVEAMRTICSNGVISRLSLLEDLRIYFGTGYVDNLCHGKFDLRREWCKVVDDSRVEEEVGTLKRLTRLQFDFSTIECFEHFLLQQQRNTNSCRFPRFKDFHLSMTRESPSFGRFADFPEFGREMKKTLMWNGGERLSSSQILNQVLRFHLISHETGTSLLHLGMENIQRLEYCEVEDCPAMETIVVESNGPSTSTSKVTSVFLNLNVLHLSKLPNLRSICEDPRHRFTKLTWLTITDCPKLSSGMIQHMPNLEVLVVRDCEGIEEIVEETNLEVLDVSACEGIEEIVMREDVEENLEIFFFPKLRVLELRSCQNLVTIWKGASQPWPSIQEIEVYDCPYLENLNLNAVDDKNPLAALEFIKGRREWWEALKWEDENSKNRLQLLFEDL